MTEIGLGVERHRLGVGHTRHLDVADVVPPLQSLDGLANEASALLVGLAGGMKDRNRALDPRRDGGDRLNVDAGVGEKLGPGNVVRQLRIQHEHPLRQRQDAVEENSLRPVLTIAAGGGKFALAEMAHGDFVSLGGAVAEPGVAALQGHQRPPPGAFGQSEIGEPPPAGLRPVSPMEKRLAEVIVKDVGSARAPPGQNTAAGRASPRSCRAIGRGSGRRGTGARSSSSPPGRCKRPTPAHAERAPTAGFRCSPARGGLADFFS